MKLRIIAILTAVALAAIIPSTLFAEETTEEEPEEVIFKSGDLFYMVDPEDPTCAFVTYEQELNGYHNDITIPSKVKYNGETLNVTGIAHQAFAFCDIKSVKIPSSVKRIGTYAFYQCSKLTRIDIPEGVQEIDMCAFAEIPNIAKFTIPASVQFIDEVAFGGCKALKEFKVSADNNFFTTADGILYEKDMSRLVCYPAGKEDQIFTLPESVVVLDQMIFADCENLHHVVLHDHLEEVGAGMFQNCSNLESVKMPLNLQILPVNTFRKCSSLYAIEGCDNVAMVGDYAFANCASIENLNFLPIATYFGAFSFSSCFSLTDVKLPETLLTIGERAFLNCSSVRSFQIGQALEEIDFGAFLFNTKLTKFIVDPLNKNFADIDGVLFSYSGDNLICYPPAREGASYTLPKATRTISCGAFLQSTLTDIEINEGLETVGQYAFQDCKNISALTLPASVKSTEMGMIARCTALELLNVQATVPPVCDGPLGQNADLEKCHLEVPEPSEMAYANAEYWCDFRFINGKEGLGVDEALSDGSQEAVWYTLQGIEAARTIGSETPGLPAGIYIRVCGNNRDRVMLR